MRLLFFAFLLPVSYCSCPDGFELVRDGECRGSRGAIVSADDAVPSPQQQAVDKCAEIGGVPVIIHDDDHQSYWSDHAVSTYTYLLLGLECNTTSKRYQWIDGSPVDYTPPTYYNPELLLPCHPECTWSLWMGMWIYGCSDMEFSNDLYCTTQLHPPLPSADGCESFEDDSEGGVCYQIASAEEDWKEAVQICGSFGADVASIHNSQENSFIRRLAVSKGAINGVYLGATQSSANPSWSDGSAWDYDNFRTGYLIAGEGDCLMMDTQITAGDWINIDCSSKRAVACSRKQHYTPPACSSGTWNEGDIIYSPGFPFDASTPCDFNLTVDAGKRVEVEVLLVEANSCCDLLTISENGATIANLTGEVLDTKYTTVSSSTVTVSWQPNGGVNVRGMMMTFRGV
ncbi:hypothetical protein PMAYCL1PPCAC_19895 [Pristionchus mayeri]|uniref:CUB domain-containing protein n=1 Tax=Pristionchus mayeri TaxID=1317129 RepID=A0AAN5CSD7_9BILA|nr:hypothetical protein PMAYCL1PPCAC_19895 [Pristionchus mayeri]